ncbi:MAG: peptidase, partial [Maribacter sp.]
ALLRTLDADEIAIPKEKLNLFPPRSFGYGRTRESINGKTGVSFDALSAPETAADMTLGLLLHPERASRLIQQKALNPSNIGLKDVFDELVGETIMRSHKDSYIQEAQNNINYRVLFHLMNLAAHDEVHPQVNAISNEHLKELKTTLISKGKNTNSMEMVRRIDDFYAHPDKFKLIPTPILPDGSPIGMDCFH